MSPPWLLACLAIGAGGTWAARAYALRRDLVDAPGERRAHTIPTPRGGGIGIVVAVLVAGVALLGEAGDRVELGLALAGVLLVAAIGFIDDHRPLSPFLRLAVQAIAAAGLAAGTWHASHEPFAAAAAFALAMALTNIWNFMDGIDGIAATQAILVALAIAAGLAGAWAWWALALAAGTLGFLPFNFPNARIFLGDVASGTLGFVLAALLVHGLAPAPPATWIAWALPPSAFLIDATLTLFRRVLRGERWWRPHSQHAYQQWARRIGSHVPVTLAYVAWTIASVLAMAWLDSGQWGAGRVGLVVLAWYTAGAGLWWTLQGKGSAAVMENTE